MKNKLLETYNKCSNYTKTMLDSLPATLRAERLMYMYGEYEKEKIKEKL